MTAKEIQSLIESHYIDTMRSNSVKITRRGGAVAYGKFLRLLQEDDDIAANKWLFSSGKQETLLDGEEITAFEKM